MENDVFKNRIAPWQEKGRWYHGVADSTGLVADSTDKLLNDEFSTDASGNFYRLRQNSASFNVKPRHIVDIKWKPSADFTSIANATAPTDYIYTTGRYIKYLSPIPATGNIEFWAFIV